MDVTPHELRDLDIADAFRGYNRDEVNELLERAATTIETQLEKIRVLTDRVGSAIAESGRTRDNDDILQRTLILAQRAADDAIAGANAEAEATRAQARVDADAMLDRARAEIARIDQEERGRIERDVLDLAGRRDALASDVAALETWDADYRDRLVQQIESDLNAARRRPAVTSTAAPQLSNVRLDDVGGQRTPAAASTNTTMTPQPPTPEATTSAPVEDERPTAKLATTSALPFEPAKYGADDTGTPSLVGSGNVPETLLSAVAEPLLERTHAVPAPPATPSVAQPVAPQIDTSAHHVEQATTATRGQHERSSYLDEVMAAPMPRQTPDIDLRAVEAERSNLDDDAFFATLRDAVRDDAPLGPADEEQMAGADRDPSFREMFKRRR